MTLLPNLANILDIKLLEMQYHSFFLTELINFSNTTSGKLNLSVGREAFIISQFGFHILLLKSGQGNMNESDLSKTVIISKF